MQTPKHHSKMIWNSKHRETNTNCVVSTANNARKIRVSSQTKSCYYRREEVVTMTSHTWRMGHTYVHLPIHGRVWRSSVPEPISIYHNWNSTEDKSLYNNTRCICLKTKSNSLYIINRSFGSSQIWLITGALGHVCSKLSWIKIYFILFKNKFSLDVGLPKCPVSGESQGKYWWYRWVNRK